MGAVEKDDAFVMSPNEIFSFNLQKKYEDPGERKCKGQTEIYTEYMYSGRSKLSFTVPLIAEPSMNVGTFLERDSLAVKVSIAHGLPLLSIV